jgi:hypothetical protein
MPDVALMVDPCTVPEAVTVVAVTRGVTTLVDADTVVALTVPALNVPVTEKLPVTTRLLTVRLVPPGCVIV